MNIYSENTAHLWYTQSWEFVKPLYVRLPQVCLCNVEWVLYRHNFQIAFQKYVGTNLKKTLSSLGIMGTKLRALLYSPQYDSAVMIRGVSGGVLNWANMLAKRRQSLGQLYVWSRLFFQPRSEHFCWANWPYFAEVNTTKHFLRNKKFFHLDALNQHDKKNARRYFMILCFFYDCMALMIVISIVIIRNI